MDATLTVGMAKDGATARHALEDDEARACALMPCPVHRRDFRAERLAERRALHACDGAERVVSSDRCDGHAVAVAAPEGLRVGVSLQREGSIQIQSIRSDLTDFELRLASHMDPTILWSAKRAVMSALELGPSLPLGAFELCPDASGKLVGAWIGTAFLPLHVQMSEPWPGFFMTTVWMRGSVA